MKIGVSGNGPHNVKNNWNVINLLKFCTQTLQAMKLIALFFLYVLRNQFVVKSLSDNVELAK